MIFNLSTKLELIYVNKIDKNQEASLFLAFSLLSVSWDIPR